MSVEEPAEAIRRRMAELRRELTSDVRDVSRSARAMTNLSFYVRRFPWATVAVAATVGYILIPKKKTVVYPDAETLAELLRKKQIDVDSAMSASQSQGMLKSLAVMGLTWAARTGMNYVVQQLTTAAAKKEKEPPAPSPLEESWKAKG